MPFVTCQPISEFLAAKRSAEPSLKWPSFELRLEQMNSMRSGDVIVVTDGREGYMTLDNAGESFRGWHGGPTESESYVPLMFSMPGTAFVDDAGEDEPVPLQFKTVVDTLTTTLVEKEKADGGDGFLRNWQLSPFLEAILTEFNRPPSSE